MAGTVLADFRLLLVTDMHKNVMQLVQQQQLAQVLGQAVKHTLALLFQQLIQPGISEGIRCSADHLFTFIAELFASCDKWGGPDAAVSSLLIARQLAESGGLAGCSRLARGEMIQS